MLPISGDVIIDGNNVKNMNNKEIASKITFIPSQIDNRISFLVKDFILLAFHQSSISVKQEETIRKVALKLDINSLLNKHIHEISDGEFQKVRIAQALVRKTKIILLDEPLAFLDYDYKLKFVKTLIQLSKNHLIIFSSHDISTIEKMKIDALYLQNGKIS